MTNLEVLNQLIQTDKTALCVYLCWPTDRAEQAVRHIREIWRPSKELLKETRESTYMIPKGLHISDAAIELLGN